MTYQIGEHYRQTAGGMVLYKDVRLYTCPAGCAGTYYDFRKARPADRPERVFGVFKAPERDVNVVGPLLLIGLGAALALMIAGFLATTLPVPVKSAAITLLVIFGVWLANSSSGPGSGGK